jgi:uncharacterized protein (TIGR03437 family)
LGAVVFNFYITEVEVRRTLMVRHPIVKRVVFLALLPLAIPGAAQVTIHATFAKYEVSVGSDGPGCTTTVNGATPVRSVADIADRTATIRVITTCAAYTLDSTVTLDAPAQLSGLQSAGGRLTFTPVTVNQGTTVLWTHATPAGSPWRGALRGDGFTAFPDECSRPPLLERPSTGSTSYVTSRGCVERSIVYPTLVGNVPPFSRPLATYYGFDFDGFNSSGSRIASGNVRIRIYYTFSTGSTPPPPPPPTGADLFIARVEPVQVVHHEETNYPLIAGRRTVVRVFIKARGNGAAPVPGVSARLFGFPAGFAGAHAPPSPLVPFTRPITAGVYTGPLPWNPDFEEESLDFLLPQAWIEPAGTFSVAAEILAPPGAPNHDPLNDVAERQLVFQQPAQSPQSFIPGRLRVGYLEVCIVARPPRDGDTGVECPAAARINGSLGTFIRRTYPLAPKDFELFRVSARRVTYSVRMPIRAPGESSGDYRTRIAIWTSDLRSALARLYHRIVISAGIDQLIGFLPDVPGPPAGSADTVFHGGEGNVAIVTLQQEAVREGYNSETLAHEIAHNLGLRHTNTILPPACTFRAPDECTTWPYDDPTIQYAGYDVVRRRVIPARDTFDLMSYCDNSDSSNMYIAAYSFRRLFENGLVPSDNPGSCGSSSSPLLALAHPSPKTQAPKTALSESPREFTQISGWIARDGASGELSPMFRVTTRVAARQHDPSSPYCLRFAGTSATLSTICFRMSFTDPETGETVTRASFSFLAEVPAATTRVALLNGTRELASLVRGAAPSISIASPLAGDRWENAGERDIVWSASASAALTYIVDYSSDGGATWTPLSMETSDTRLTIDPSGIVGGNNVYFRVQASNGFETATALAGPVIVAQSPQLTARPAAVDFRNALPGQAAERKLTLTNSGRGPLRVTDATTTNSAFSITYPRTPFAIAAGDSVEMSLEYTPPSAGAASATLRLTSNSATNPAVTIPLQGTGIAASAPDAGVSATAIDFGTVAVNGAVTRELTLHSFGPAALRVNSVTTSGAGFSVSGAAAPLTLAVTDESVFTVRFAPLQAGTANGSVVFATDDPDEPSITVTLRGLGSVSAGAAPSIAAGGVVGAASFSAPLAPGQVSALFGSDLSTVTAGATAVPLPTTLGGVQVRVSGFLAPLFYVSPTQINFQTPFEVPAGTAETVVIRNGVASPGVPVTVAGYAPQIFTYARTAAALDPIVVHADNSLVTPANPARAREVLIAYTTGMGPLRNTPASGAAAPGPPFATLIDTPVVTLGGAPVTVHFAGLTPGGVGLGQLNLELPATLPAGGCAPLVIRVAGVSSRPLNLATAAGGCDAPPPARTVLQIDDGAFERIMGAGGTEASFVNRLTPPSYPATLRAIRIFFHEANGEGLPSGTPINLMFAGNPTGGSGIDAIQFHMASAVSGAPNRFTEFEVPPVTIQSGDFLVGFRVFNPPGIFPMANDTSSGYRNRSYISTNGTTYRLLGDIPGITPGNFMIRAVVD